jgi:hypothetical protein
VTAGGESTSLSGNFNSFGFYTFIQDDWKVNSRLTLNLGVRYEIHSRYVEVQNRQAYFDRNFPGGRLLLAGTSQAFIAPNSLVPGPATPRGLFPANKGDIGPRIGIAFRPFADNRTAIRAGYGIFYSMVDGQATRQLERDPPNGQIISLTADPNENSLAPGAVTVGNLFPLAGTPASQPTVYTDIGARKDPSIQQWNVNIQRQMLADILVELGYMGSKGIHEVYYSQGNQALLDANPASPTPILSRRLFPLWGSGMRTAGGDGVTSYEGGYVKLEKRFATGLSFLAHYSLGKALDYSSQVKVHAKFVRSKMGKGEACSTSGTESSSRHYELGCCMTPASKPVLAKSWGAGRSTPSPRRRAAFLTASRSAGTCNGGRADRHAGRPTSGFIPASSTHPTAAPAPANAAWERRTKHTLRPWQIASTFL